MIANYSSAKVAFQRSLRANSCIEMQGRRSVKTIKNSKLNDPNSSEVSVAIDKDVFIPSQLSSEELTELRRDMMESSAWAKAELARRRKNKGERS